MKAIKLFRIAGIQVYLSWWWFLLAIYEIQARRGEYSSVTWNIAEYVALFAIVLTHEFGHALATRQVGGTADKIMLWPLGGVAYVDPPQRPGATLWAIAAGPLVNVALAPILLMIIAAAGSLNWSIFFGDVDAGSNLSNFLWQVLRIDVGLFLFNILPIYPLDGGQILRSLLWFVMGRGKSLMTATVIGFLGLFGFVGLALLDWSHGNQFNAGWFLLIAFYAGSNCWNAFKAAQAMLRQEKIARRMGLKCPSCGMAPPVGRYWGCANCHQSFDTFESGGRCPHCSTQYGVTTCLDCRRSAPRSEWAAGDWVGAAR
jgi:Zn-dependent protease/DNA-directed RNA polymerase subunit RPC12/RpoP